MIILLLLNKNLTLYMKSSWSWINVILNYYNDMPHFICFAKIIYVKISIYCFFWVWGKVFSKEVIPDVTFKKEFEGDPHYGFGKDLQGPKQLELLTKFSTIMSHTCSMGETRHERQNGNLRTNLWLHLCFFQVETTSQSLLLIHK